MIQRFFHPEAAGILGKVERGWTGSKMSCPNESSSSLVPSGMVKELFTVLSFEIRSESIGPFKLDWKLFLECSTEGIDSRTGSN